MKHIKNVFEIYFWFLVTYNNVRMLYFADLSLVILVIDYILYFVIILVLSGFLVIVDLTIRVGIVIFVTSNTWDRGIICHLEIIFNVQDSYIYQSFVFVLQKMDVIIIATFVYRFLFYFSHTIYSMFVTLFLTFWCVCVCVWFVATCNFFFDNVCINYGFNRYTFQSTCNFTISNP